MGLLMSPLGLAVCLLFADGNGKRRWANLLVWGSLAALSVGVVNSIRLNFLLTMLWRGPHWPD